MSSCYRVRRYANKRIAYKKKPSLTATKSNVKDNCVLASENKSVTKTLNDVTLEGILTALSTTVKLLQQQINSQQLRIRADSLKSSKQSKTRKCKCKSTEKLDNSVT